MDSAIVPFRIAANYVVGVARWFRVSLCPDNYIKKEKE